MASRIEPEGGWGSRLKPFKTAREQKPNHLAFVRKLPCVCCATGDMRAGFLSGEIQAAHIRQGSEAHGKEPTGGQQKPDDRWSLPLCGEHHAEQHDMNEDRFWKRYGVDQFLLALVLWGLTGKVWEATHVLGLHAGMAQVKRSVTRPVTPTAPSEKTDT